MKMTKILKILRNQELTSEKIELTHKRDEDHCNNESKQHQNSVNKNEIDVYAKRKVMMSERKYQKTLTEDPACTVTYLRSDTPKDGHRAEKETKGLDKQKK